jgi:hypothetical protein
MRPLLCTAFTATFKENYFKVRWLDNHTVCDDYRRHHFYGTRLASLAWRQHSSINRGDEAAWVWLTKTWREWSLLSALTGLSGLVSVKEPIILSENVVDVVSRSQWHLLWGVVIECFCHRFADWERPLEPLMRHRSWLCLLDHADSFFMSALMIDINKNVINRCCINVLTTHSDLIKRSQKEEGMSSELLRRVQSRLCSLNQV